MKLMIKMRSLYNSTKILTLPLVSLQTLRSKLLLNTTVTYYIIT